MTFLTTSIQCPTCDEAIARRDLTPTPTVKANNGPVSFWTALASPKETLKCPHCHTHLRPDFKSFWPILLLIPATGFYGFMPIVWATSVFVLVGLFVATYARFGTRYKSVK